MFLMSIYIIAIVFTSLMIFSPVPITLYYGPKDQEAMAQPNTTASSPCINYNQSARLIIVTCTSANLSDVYNELKDPSILDIQKQRLPDHSFSSSNNVWLLNANLTVSKGAVLYINSTDTSWLKIISDRTTAYNIDVHGSLKVDSVAITSWNPATNYYAISNGTRILQSSGYEVHAGSPRPFIKIDKDATGTTDITNSEIAYLGYEGGVGASVTGLTYLGGHGSILRHNNLHDLYFGFYSSNVGDMIIEGNHIYNNSKYGLDPHTGTHGMLIRNNVVNDNGGIGIICSLNCYNITIEDNQVYRNAEPGIFFSRNMYNSIARNNYVHDEATGIFISQSHDNEIYNNTISNTTNAIYVKDNSSNNNIYQNTVIKSANGINVKSAGNGNTVYSNTIMNGSQTGKNITDIGSTASNTITDNKATHHHRHRHHH